MEPLDPQDCLSGMATWTGAVGFMETTSYILTLALALRGTGREDSWPHGLTLNPRPRTPLKLQCKAVRDQRSWEPVVTSWRKAGLLELFTVQKALLMSVVCGALSPQGRCSLHLLGVIGEPRAGSMELLGGAEAPALAFRLRRPVLSSISEGFGLHFLTAPWGLWGPRRQKPCMGLGLG